LINFLGVLSNNDDGMGMLRIKFNFLISKATCFNLTPATSAFKRRKVISSSGMSFFEPFVLVSSHKRSLTNFTDWSDNCLEMFDLALICWTPN